MNLTVLIVDDKPILGGTIKKNVDRFQSMHTDVTYSSILIEGIDCFEQAKKHILSHQSEIDLLLIDYNLETHLKGTDLFKFIDTSKYQIYKILVSITTKARHLASKEFQVLYDDFCPSKDPGDIIKALEDYEKDILSTKLWGNISFRGKYFINDNSFRLKENWPILEKDNIRLFDILYAETDGSGKENTTIHFHNKNNNTIDTKPIRKLPIKRFVEANLFFKRVSGSMVINLLWVAKIDISKNRIRFIAMDNLVHEIDFIPTTGCFDNEILPYLSEIDTIPLFFKS